MIPTQATTFVEQWGIFELALHGSAEGNPYLEVELTAQFAYKHRVIEVNGFYDGDGVYRIRFMPDTQGSWHYRTQSNLSALGGIEGTFTCLPPAPDNHGPARVAHTYHFAYVDGTPYKPVGTTCYAWMHQSDETLRQVVETAANSGQAVIIGRASQVILAGRRDVLHVRVAAPLQARIDYVALREGLDEAGAQARVQLKDRDRSRYLQTVYHRHVDDPMLYDLVLNTGVLSLDRAVELICQTLEGKAEALSLPVEHLGPARGLARYVGRPGDIRPPARLTDTSPSS